MSARVKFISWLPALLLAACAAPVAGPLSPAQLPDQVLLPYSFYGMAFDGSNLWQVAEEDKQQYLIKQSLLGKELLRLSLSEKIPVHRSLAWGRDQLWALDADNTIRVLSPQGKIVQTLKLTALSEPGIAEQLVWASDQLWLLVKSYVQADGQTALSRFYRLDPADGKILAELKVDEPPLRPDQPFVPFTSFLHQNLSADDKAFYVARANIFDKDSNQVFRIDRSSGKMTKKALERVVTGFGTSFFWQGSFFAIELIDTSNCGDYCRGKLEKLTRPE